MFVDGVGGGGGGGVGANQTKGTYVAELYMLLYGICSFDDNTF